MGQTMQTQPVNSYVIFRNVLKVSGLSIFIFKMRVKILPILPVFLRNKGGIISKALKNN